MSFIKDYFNTEILGKKKTFNFGKDQRERAAFNEEKAKFDKEANKMGGRTYDQIPEAEGLTKSKSYTLNNSGSQSKQYEKIKKLEKSMTGGEDYEYSKKTVPVFKYARKGK